jgi:hypothetical protein
VEPSGGADGSGPKLLPSSGAVCGAVWERRPHRLSGPERLPRARSGQNPHMDTAVVVIVSVTTALTVTFVLGLFVWAARKDGEYDRSVQKRLGIRRRTRL